MAATQHWCQMRANRVEVLERFNRILKQTAHHFPVKECYLPSPGGGNTGYIEVMTLKSTIRTKISMMVRDDSFLKKSEYEYSTVTRHVHTPEPCRPRYLCTDSEELEPDRDRSPSPLQSLNGNYETDGVATSRRGNNVPSVVSTLEGSNQHTRRVAHPQAPVGEVARERRPLNTYLSLAPETMGPETGISTTNNASGPYTIGNGTVNEPATASSKPPGWTDLPDPPCNVCHREATVWMVESKDWSSRLHLAIPFCMGCALEPNTFRTILVKQMWPMITPCRYRQLWVVRTTDPGDHAREAMSMGIKNESQELMQLLRNQGEREKVERREFTRSRRANMSDNKTMCRDSDDGDTSGVSMGVCLSEDAPGGY